MQLDATYTFSDVYVHDFAKQRFFHDVFNRGYPVVFFRSYISDVGLGELLKALGVTNQEPEAWAETAGSHWSTHKVGEVLLTLHAVVSADQRKFHFHIAAPNKSAADAVVEKLNVALPEPTQGEENVVPVSFWTMSANGPTSYQRKIEAERWTQITHNYSEELRGKLDALMSAEPPFGGGRLILWHGPPGTGKTHALSSLTRSWVNWCKPQYVVDPERFFGEASYMLHVLLSDPDQIPYGLWDDEEEEEEEDETPPAWRLLIAEDADEFLVADARERSGQALARLLNVADGLVGQGLNLLVLITTNQELSAIHPAVKREGRCVANMNFGSFSKTEAAKWLEQNEMDPKLATKDMSLAQLYELTKERRQIKTETAANPTGMYI